MLLLKLCGWAVRWVFHVHVLVYWHIKVIEVKFCFSRLVIMDWARSAVKRNSWRLSALHGPTGCSTTRSLAIFSDTWVLINITQIRSIPQCRRCLISLFITFATLFPHLFPNSANVLHIKQVYPHEIFTRLASHTDLRSTVAQQITQIWTHFYFYNTELASNDHMWQEISWLLRFWYNRKAQVPISV